MRTTNHAGRQVPAIMSALGVSVTYALAMRARAEANRIYTDPRRDEWQTKILPALRKIPVSILMNMSGKSRSMIFEVLAARSRPHRQNQQLFVGCVRDQHQAQPLFS
jgi:hypothetical protein